MNWMIYGANGYTGELIAKEAKKRGLTPILAGRSEDKIKALAADLGLSQRIFALESGEQIAHHLKDVGLVLHCAGPFSATSAPMIDGCLRAKAHYLDITGEIAVFEHAQSRDSDAKAADVVLCPGVGFDVIPTDCVAAALKEALPDAEHLSLGFDSRSSLSPGTAKTSVEGLGQGGKVRKAGTIVNVPFAYRVRRIDFGDGEKLAMTIPWGDVSTAFYTTGIPDIDVFVPGSPGLIANAKRANHILWLLRSRPVQALLKRGAARQKGPSETARAEQPTYVWGEVTNAKGQKKTARIRTENGYSVTVTGALLVVESLLRQKPKGGAYTPSRLMGADLVTKLPGSSAITIE